MTIDYDVVIIGGSLAGRYAALAATQLHATVALVEPKVNYGLIHHHTLSKIGRLAQQLHNAVNLGIPSPTANTAPEIYLNGVALPTVASSEKLPIPLDSSEAMLYARGIVSNLAELNSPAKLAALGVDVIFGNGQFQSSPQLAFDVSDAEGGQHQRLLRARTYLLASGSSPAIPKIDGLQATGYLTLANIWQSLNEPTPPKNWVIIGGVPQSIEIAQTLAWLGYSVTLIVKHAYILSNIDPEIAQLLQAQLEVDGVRVLTQTPVTQVRRIEDKKWIQAGDKAIETDEILVVTKQQPNLKSLNLAAVGVKWHEHRLVVNDKLQTTNHRIYACGDVIGGYDLANVANYEASIALKNALFFPAISVNYQCIPWATFTQPMLAQVGLTEAQAKRRFGQDKVLVLRQYFKSITAAQIRGEITGVCKIIVLENGEILGSAILGAKAGELINLIALAMSQKIYVKHLANLSTIYPSFSDILEQTAREWSKQRLNRNTALQDFLEDFFQFRRDWNL
ncbi:pyruvate/2-oxoglutarate dehydrogenase complex, dihydrolipoamide dehydrogenase component [Cylindrospermum stagnale PCC 7417]|uniref:Pyruvate/2-oxoglutarate dehydrogenase complex, dihydrolipoamide dehydrogenase component n=1 Tax=Cylindrospermum stagnale PCC 7417 TaxID=56107 RepID=K9X1S2_9NOST|nr:NAD(P)/FAD-dependent oxidoreductase [Cylindrospermum stagnale]AFZ26428.1 pyruvate/2-oxoglutarate dehydrogenase complex, dihydrolipoamide dehydrogenase component [Cylindrospermum stagnale PCC 7417]